MVTDADYLMKLRSDAKEFKFLDKDGFVLASLEPISGVFSLWGSTNVPGSLNIYDGATVALSVALDGATIRFGSTSAGPIQIDPADGQAIVLDSSTITINDGDITSITGAELETVTHHHGQEGAGYFDFTDVCADGETITIDGKTFEFDTTDGTACAGGYDYCIDVNASQAAAACATALVSKINGASENFSAVLETDIAMIVGHTVGIDLSLAETGTNITRSAATFHGEETAQKHVMHHIEHTFLTADEAALTGASGAICVGGIESSAGLPHLFGWSIEDASGEAVTTSNISIAIKNTTGNQYAIIVKDSGAGGSQIDATDFMSILFIDHE